MSLKLAWLCLFLLLQHCTAEDSCDLCKTTMKKLSRQVKNTEVVGSFSSSTVQGSTMSAQLPSANAAPSTVDSDGLTPAEEENVTVQQIKKTMYELNTDDQMLAKCKDFMLLCQLFDSSFIRDGAVYHFCTARTALQSRMTALYMTLFAQAMKNNLQRSAAETIVGGYCSKLSNCDVYICNYIEELIQEKRFELSNKIEGQLQWDSATALQFASQVDPRRVDNREELQAEHAENIQNMNLAAIEWADNFFASGDKSTLAADLNVSTALQAQLATPISVDIRPPPSASEQIARASRQLQTIARNTNE